MSEMKVTHRQSVRVSVPNRVILELDGLVAQGAYPDRAAAFEAALAQLLRSRQDAQIEAEVDKLGREAEKTEAEMGMDDFAELLNR